MIVDNHLDPRDTVTVEFCDLKGEVLVVQTLVELREVTLDLQQQACQ